jgi:hypothetical protein
VSAPIVLFVYNRPWHTIRTLEALSANDQARESQLFIFSDGAKVDANIDDLEKIREVREIIRSKKWCGEVTISEANYNKGLANSIVEGVTEIVARFGKVIVLEDDLVTSPGFLNFMNQGLELYKDEEKVMDISGYCFPIVNFPLPDIFFLEMASSWGWATWHRAWAHFTVDTNLLHRRLLKEKKFDSFLKIGQENFRTQLMSNLNGEIHSWAIKWQAVITLQNGLSLQPGKSLVNNIGFDSSGTHYNVIDNSFKTTTLANCLTMVKVPTVEIRENKEIAKIYRSFYSRTDNSQYSKNAKRRIFKGLRDRFNHYFK